MTDPTVITGRNPVREALRAQSRPINKIYIARTARGGPISDIIALAKDHGVPVHHVPPERLDAYGGTPTQGVVAEVSPQAYLSMDELLASAATASDPLIIILDGIEDPHNLGAIIRSAVAFGAVGLVMGKWRAAGLTESAVRASAGASEHLAIARVSNIAESIRRAAEAGYWVVGTDASGRSIAQAALRFPLALVIGGEGSGLHRLVRERCDEIVAIPQDGRIASLNASCAAAIVLYETFRKRLSPQEPTSRA